MLRVPYRRPNAAVNLALFDFDGTISDRELFGAFVASAVPQARLRRGRWRFAPSVLGYKLGLVSGSAIRARVVDYGFRGLDAAGVEQAGRRFADEVLPASIRPEALQRIAWHREQGDTVVVVSGAFDVYLRHWCERHGLDLICSQLDVEDGVLTGRYRGAQCVGKEKPRLVRERYDLSRYAQIYAYGDTREDLDMLALAHRRWYHWQEMP